MAPSNPKQMFGSAHIGFNIQRSIAKVTTYRLRRGNGHYGSKLGELYQDKYDYFVTDPQASHCPAGAKTCFANAVAAWQASSDAVKKWHNNLANHIRNLSGFNLFIRRYMQANY